VDSPASDREMSIWEHLEELGKRIRRGLILFAVVFIATWLPVPSPGSNPLDLLSNFLAMTYDPVVSYVIRNYMISLLPSDVRVISTGLLTPFVITMEVSLLIALLVSLPYLVYEIYQYIKPALYPHELKPVRNYTVLGVVLFYLGAFVGYFLIFPSFLRISVYWSTELNLAPYLTASGFMDTLLATVLFAGVIFETPIIINLLSRIGIVDLGTLSRNRPYIYFGALVLIAIVNPDPTLVSTMLWFIMFIALYEFGYLWSRSTVRHRDGWSRRVP
jgi:sec-independent protein translocase protein TatC